MVSSEEIKALSDAERRALLAKRLYLRRIYCGNGSDLLMDIIRGSKVFDKTDPADVAENGARNFVVDLLTEMGMFDEGFIEFAIKALGEFPLMPMDKEKV